MDDVKIIFPDAKEKMLRTRRGYLPVRYISAPTFDEMVKQIYGQPLFKSESISGSSYSITNHFYLLKKDDVGFGYIKLQDMRETPFNKSCKSFQDLQSVYNNIANSSVWRPKLPDLVNYYQHRTKISGNNINFFNQVKEKFKDLFPEVAIPKPKTISYTDDYRSFYDYIGNNF